MIFWTFVLLLFYGYAVIKGNFFGNLVAEIGKIALKLKEMETGEDVMTEYNKKELTKKMLILTGITIIPAIALLIIEIIYYCSAISVDPYKFPSIAMLLLFVLNCIWAKLENKKANLETEEGRKNYRELIARSSKRYTARGIFIASTKFLYFAYMFWVLSFSVAV